MSVLHRSLKKAYPRAVRGEGVYLWDADGKRYLDFSGSAAVNLIGHGRAEVAQAIANQAQELEFVHSSQFTTDIAENFGKALIRFAGAGFAGGRVFFTCGGSEAVETALKLARQYQVELGQAQRFRVVSRQQAYHGATLGALAVSGNKRRREIYLPMVRGAEAFPQIGMPYCYRCAYQCNDCAEKYAKELELALAEPRGTVAAFIAEPMSGATLGAVAPPAGYFARIREICDTHGVLLIADEIMTGCGRTGRNFAMEHFGATPDIIVMAKGLSSGYMPLGAVIASRKVVEVLEQGSGAFTHGFTYNAHPLAVAAGDCVLRIMQSQALVDAAANLEQTMRSQLETLLTLPQVGDVRGKGLLWGVEFVEDKTTMTPFAAELGFAAKVGAGCARRGVMVYPMQGTVDGTLGDHLLIAPPAVITTAEVAHAATVIGEAVVEAARGT